MVGWIDELIQIGWLSAWMNGWWIDARMDGWIKRLMAGRMLILTNSWQNMLTIARQHNLKLTHP
jgi:hypothetical protein